jgi:glycosyltransferase involved in cell wall biosynthesis
VTQQFQPQISIIIPTLREEKLLPKVLEQFTPELKKKYNLEVIVSDGGSTDGTLEIAKQYADVLIQNPEGQFQNISRGRNLGAKAARGEILCFINGDTIIERIHEFFPAVTASLKNKGITGLTCNVYVHKEEETLFDKIFHTIYNRYFQLLNLLGIGMGRGECQVVTKQMFEQVGGYDEGIAAGEDFYLFVKLRRHGKIAFLRSFTVRESPRRYRKYGYLWISFLWFINAFSVFCFKRSVVKEWKPVR